MAKKKKEFEYEFDPIKESKDGKDLSIVWTTKALEKAVDAIDKGLPLKANPFIGKMTKLLRPDLVYKRTEEEIDDFIQCKEDPVYFATKCFLMTPEGLQSVKLRDYQVEYLHLLKNNRFTILKSARQCGKCINLSTEKIVIKSNPQITSKIEKYCHFYNIKDNIIELPMFEIYNIFCKQTFLWKIKHYLYCLIYKLDNNG